MDAGAAADPSRFANGISIALYATLMGLLIAIPALIAWSYYSRKSKPSPSAWRRSAMNSCAKHYRTEASSPNGEPVAAPAPLRSGRPPKLH